MLVNEEKEEISLAEVEACFRQAISIARQQEAKSWELRATVDLSKLLFEQGRPDEARKELATIYGWFSEGYDTPDLLAAKRLLVQMDLASTPSVSKPKATNCHSDRREES